MSLDWNAEKVEGLEELHKLDPSQDYKTAYLCFELMRVGVNRITEDNVEDVWTRIDMMQRLEGPLFYYGEDRTGYIREDIVRRIGYSTNVSNEDFGKVLARKYKQELVDNKRVSAKELLV